jgi:hypothetical protein
MKNLMSLYKNERTNDYFKNYAIMQIKIAHRIKEYLDADEYFKPKDISKSTMDLFLQGKVEEAVGRILNEVSFDCGSSSGYDSMEKEAIGFAKELLAEYHEKNKKLLSERERLMAKVKEIDKHLNR